MKIKNIIILFFLIIIFLFFSYWRGINVAADKNGEDKVFVITRGQGVNEISDSLYNAGLIKSKFYFEIYVWVNRMESKLLAGEYLLNPKLNVKEIADIITTGKTEINEITVRIIEGWTINDISDYFKKMGITRENDFIELARDKEKIKLILSASNLNIYPDSLEGFLFPDTYRIFKNSTVEDIIRKIIRNFNDKFNDEIRRTIEASGKTVYDILIMASLLEKEVKTYQDMRIVSGIFWDRIKHGMPLQSDASLSYILNDKKPVHNLNDLKIDSQFNSYKYKGLPPTPICNPGMNAIKAAINPEITEYNYFLNRPDTGETIFSVTYEEHSNNKKKYLEN